jgi:hypothetical protein
VLTADEISDDRDIEILALEGKICWPEEEQPENRDNTTCETANPNGETSQDCAEDVKDDCDHDKCDPQTNGLDRVKLYEWSISLVLDE